MKVIRLIATFHSSYALASLIITISCLSIVFKWGSDTLTMIFWLKILTYSFIIYYIQYFKDDVFYYFKNKGIIITDHLYKHITDICDTIYVISEGKTHIINNINEIESLGYARVSNN